MFYSSSGCPETTVNAFETKERQFSQNEIYHTTELCDVEISYCSSFLGKAGFSNIPCVKVRAVAKKQRKMFEHMKKLVFLERSFLFHATVFLAFKIVRNAYMSRAWNTGNGHLLAPRATR